jgi:hypothetical protein
MREGSGRWVEGGHFSDRTERPGLILSAVAFSSHDTAAPYE